jgi:hypothetical protein
MVKGEKHQRFESGSMKARGFSLWIFMAAVLAAASAVAQTAPVTATVPTQAVQQLQQQMQAQTPAGALPQTVPAPAPTPQYPSRPSAVPEALTTAPAGQPATLPIEKNIRPSPATDLLLSHQTAELTSKTDPDDVIDIQKQIADPYLEASLPNLAKAYWAVGAFDWNDDRALDNYLQITECPLYQQYFSNEFEWVNIRNAAKIFLQKNISKLPTRFEAVIPIVLGKYDPETSQFDILPNYQKHALLRILIETSANRLSDCVKREDVQEYPRNFVALLERPFTITTVPVDPRIAEFYLNDIRLNYQNKNSKVAPSDYERVAYLRLKIKLLQFKETERTTNGGLPYNAIFSKIEGWDVYADAQETKPLMMYNVPAQAPLTTFMAGQNMNLIAKNPANNDKIYMPRDARALPPAQ